jgi:NHLM bacteriocin system ABC transporter ATP-binding protein
VGLYDEQIRQRIKSDSDGFTRSFAELAGSVMGGVPLAETEDAVIAKNAIEAILKYYKLPIPEIPAAVTEMDKQLEYTLSRSGLAKREIKLTKNWQKTAFGAVLAKLSDGTYVALLPGKWSGYHYYDYKTGRAVKITSKTDLAEDAYCFYKPFPAKAITGKDFFRFILNTLQPKDFLWLGAAVLAATAVGLATPYITAQLFGNVMELGQVSVLLAAAAVLAGAAVSTLLINILRAEAQDNIGRKARVSVSAAVFMRVLSLKAAFFRDKPAGEIARRMSVAQSLCELITVNVAVSILTALFSLIYVGQIFIFAPSLVVPAVCILAFTVVISLITVLATMKHTHELMEGEAHVSGITMSLFSGVQKLKLAGAEKRAFSKWASIYAHHAKIHFLPPLIVRFEGLFSVLITGISTLIFYFAAVQSGVSVADYMAFFAAFGMASASFLQLTDTARSLTQIKTIFKSIAPILGETPETSEGGTIIDRLSGSIEFSNVSFRYDDNMPLVLDNLSLKIPAGQYVAICGKTGCGKSTLMRLMLGFETPQKGAIYYDGRDLARIEKRSLRKNAVGVVMQNGSLFQGDIYSNIVISAPWLNIEDAWAAAEIAGIADDIRAMPMGMHTVISEGQGGVSGGQKQRLMIARAIAGKPKILMLDEATSALDNITQKHVADSLSKLKCTRVIIAHRLSTIKDCDRIILLENGKIAEDGTYNELIAQNGAFAELVKRQQVE